MQKTLRKVIATIFLGMYALYTAIPTPVFALTLTSNIISYYKLDDASGDAADSVGTNTLTNTGAGAYSTALINNGYDQGTSNSSKYLARTDAGGYPGTDYSVSMWIKVKTEITGNPYYVFNMVDNGGTNTRFVMSYNWNAGTPNVSFDRVKLNVSDNIITWSSGALGTTNWYHIVVTYDSINGSIMYVNNVSRGTNAGTGNGAGGSAAATSFSIGVTTTAGGPAATMGSFLIDEVGTWGRALTSSEVTQLYNAGAGLQYPFAVASAPRAFWLFNDF